MKKLMKSVVHDTCITSYSDRIITLLDTQTANSHKYLTILLPKQDKPSFSFSELKQIIILSKHQTQRDAGVALRLPESEILYLQIMVENPPKLVQLGKFTVTGKSSKLQLLLLVVSQKLYYANKEISERLIGRRCNSICISMGSSEVAI